MNYFCQSQINIVTKNNLTTFTAMYFYSNVKLKDKKIQIITLFKILVLLNKQREGRKTMHRPENIIHETLSNITGHCKES